MNDGTKWLILFAVLCVIGIFGVLFLQLILHYS